MKQKTIVWILVLVLVIQTVTALGIRPAKTTIISEESLNYSGSFSVVNNGQQELTLKIYAAGDLKEYVKLKTTELRFRDIDESKEVEFEVNLPDDLEPETSIVEIFVEEALEDNLKNTVSSKIVIKHKIIIEGPYPDKYVKTKLNFQDLGDSIGFVSEVENFGKEDIDSIQTTFYANDKKQDLYTIKSETVKLAKNENKLLKVEIEKDFFGNGEFDIAAVTSYDGQTTETVKKMFVGKPEVNILYFDSYFIANKINAYSMDLLNNWNKKVENVFVDIEVKKDSERIDSFRTKSVDINGFLTERIEDFFDARNKNPGKYSFDMVVNFWNTYKMETETFHSELLTEEEFEIKKKEIEIIPTNYTINETQEEKLYTDGFKMTIYLLVITNVIIILALFYFFFFRKRDEEF
ncbi:MAG: hypothetical protein ABH824_05640 [Nanoarchaeota archaeon]|nr:hypothetical protein [Nanoarchaeota archaeon]MBU1632330.1 hypothetical protein [Nanoarchaeota archaeon]MBU1875889.1 hypothetical protein [Nanoarchaeota archaeon]